MRYGLCNFANLWKRGKMGCFERLISAVCWSLTAHFCINKSKNAFCFLAGVICIAPAPLQLFFWKSFSDYPTPFFIAGFLVFVFIFWQKNKRTFEFGRFSYEAYVLVSGLFFTLAFGRWLWLCITSCWNLRLSESRAKLAWVCRAWANWTTLNKFRMTLDGVGFWLLILSCWIYFSISPRVFLVLVRGQILKQVQDDV